MNKGVASTRLHNYYVLPKIFMANICEHREPMAYYVRQNSHNMLLCANHDHPTY